MQIYFPICCNSTRISLKMQVFLDALERVQFPDFIVGRWETLSLAIVRALQRSRGTGPRATMTKRFLSHRGGLSLRAEKNASPHRRARACPSPSLAPSNARGGQAPALREHRDQEGSPTGGYIETRRARLPEKRNRNEL